MSWWQTILIGRNPRRTLWRAGGLALVCTVVFQFVLRPAVLDGPSMEPTVPSRGLRFINLLAYRVGEPRRGDIVAVRMSGQRMFYLKRILGLPGETIELRDGALVIDGQEIPEPYLAERGDWTMAPRVLGPDEYWVAGDNRAMPMAGHKLGATRRRFIAGRLFP